MVQNGLDSSVLQLAQASLLQILVRFPRDTLAGDAPYELLETAAGVEFGSSVHQSFNDPISKLEATLKRQVQGSCDLSGTYGDSNGVDACGRKLVDVVLGEPCFPETKER